MRVLLISTYDLGRQPFGLASPAAWLRREGIDVECVDASRDEATDEQIRAAGLIAFYLPMHTATRLAAPLIQRARATNPEAVLAAYGLYAPLNERWLRARGVAHVVGPEAEGDLVALAGSHRGPRSSNTASPLPRAIPRLPFIQPDRSSLPPLSRYAALQMPDGTRRVVGSTDATRGCKHLCRHCPIVPVYGGAFRVVPVDVVLADIRAQVEAGAKHISFGDPDFFNGPVHARRIVERFAGAFPGVTYDVTIKIEHLLRHADLLTLLRDTGCLFITSAVESIDDAVLEKLRKGHTRADFQKAVGLCRGAGITLSPTFVPFTPWATLDGYLELLDQLSALDLESVVAPIQLAIRLLVTADSALLELPEVRDLVEPFDGSSLTWPWHHHDARVDALQRDVMQIVSRLSGAPRADVFETIRAAARTIGGVDDREARRAARAGNGARGPTLTPPYMTEAWYCCAEPTSSLRATVDEPVSACAKTGKFEMGDYV